MVLPGPKCLDSVTGQMTIKQLHKRKHEMPLMSRNDHTGRQKGLIGSFARSRAGKRWHAAAGGVGEVARLTLDQV
jgi:hypothetical protein